MILKINFFTLFRDGIVIYPSHFKKRGEFLFFHHDDDSIVMDDTTFYHIDYAFENLIIY